MDVVTLALAKKYALKMNSIGIQSGIGTPTGIEFTLKDATKVNIPISDWMSYNQIDKDKVTHLITNGSGQLVLTNDGTYKLINNPNINDNKNFVFTSSQWIQDIVDNTIYTLTLQHKLNDLNITYTIYNSEEKEETIGVQIIDADTIKLTSTSSFSGRIVINYSSSNGQRLENIAVVRSDYMFATNTDRDNYFSISTNSLQNGLVILVGSGVSQVVYTWGGTDKPSLYDNLLWYNSTVLLKGETGLKGDKPNHIWNNTTLQIENPDGTYDNGVDLKGIQGETGTKFKVRGQWLVNTPYIITDSSIDVVTYDGKTYCALIPSTGKRPDISSTYWGVLIDNALEVDTDIYYKNFLNEATNPVFSIGLVDESNISSQTDIGKLLLSSDGKQYVVNQDGTKLQFTDIKFVSALPISPFKDILYILTTDKSINYYTNGWNAINGGFKTDDVTCKIENDKIVVKSLDNMTVSTVELNYLQGLDENLMTKLSTFINGGVEVYTAKTFNTYAELLAFNFTTLTTGKIYLIYVGTDENHESQGTTYMCDSTTNNTTNLPKYSGLSSATQRILSVNQVDLTSEVKNVLPISQVATDTLVLKSEIVDSLTDTSINKPLSANQGSVIQLKLDTKQNINDSNLTTTSKTITGAINEVKTQINNTTIDLVEKQNKADSSLTTTTQTVVGGINELNSKVAIMNNDITNNLDPHLTNTTNPHSTKTSNLSDSNIASPIDGQSYVFDGVINKWVNKSILEFASSSDIQQILNQ